MEQTGIVLKTEGGSAMVRIIRSAQCDNNCDDCKLCTQREKTYWVENTVHANTGERVKIEMKSSAFFLMAFVAYLLPIIAAGAVSYFISPYFENRAVADMISLLVLAASIFLLTRIDRVIFRGGRYRCRITEVIGDNEQA